MASELDKISRSELRKEVEIKRKTYTSYEYGTFIKEKVERRNWYEVACQKIGGLTKLPISKKEQEVLEEQIIKADLNVKPMEVMVFSVIVLLASMVMSVLVMLLSGQILTFILLPVSFYGYTYIKNYPQTIAKKRMLEETSEMVLGVLYIVIYMRHTPNLEAAVKFASNNLQGHLGNDFKLLLWNIQTKKSTDVFEALNDFLIEWRDRNKPFVDAMHLIMSALHQINEKQRKETLDMAVESMLDGTYEQMVKYANKLRTPVQAVSLIGITLPIMGLVMLPMISAFLSDVVTSEMIFYFYDLILPLLVLFFINRALGERPVGFAIPDISTHPDAPPKNKFYLTIGKERRAVPIFIIPVVIFVLGLLLYLGYVYSVQGLAPSRDDVFGSLTIVMGLMFAAASYFYLSSFQKVEIRDKIGSVESDFTSAAYILSNMLSEGKPLELSLIRTAEEMKSSKIHDFFAKIETNVKQLGMDMERAIFDSEHGAILLYPSMLVNSIMRILVSTSKESTEAAAMSMNNIGRYTKSIHKIDEKIKDILSETISSITFQANFIAPLITGVVVGLSTMIFLILNNLGEQIGSMAEQGSDLGGVSSMNVNFILGFLNLSSSVDVWAFQPIVGIYLILVVMLMVYLINKIEFAGDNIYFMHRAARTLIISVALYTIIVAFTTLLFTGLADIAISVGGAVQ